MPPETERDAVFSGSLETTITKGCKFWCPRYDVSDGCFPCDVRFRKKLLTKEFNLFTFPLMVLSSNTNVTKTTKCLYHSYVGPSRIPSKCLEASGYLQVLPLSTQWYSNRETLLAALSWACNGWEFFFYYHCDCCRIGTVQVARDRQWYLFTTILCSPTEEPVSGD